MHGSGNFYINPEFIWVTLDLYEWLFYLLLLNILLLISDFFEL